MDKLTIAAEEFLQQLKVLRKEESLWIPQHLWPILDKCYSYIKDNIQEIFKELEQKTYIGLLTILIYIVQICMIISKKYSIMGRRSHKYMQ